MATKKYMTLERIQEYDVLIKNKIDSGDTTTLSSANKYTDEKVSGLSNGSVVVKEAEHASTATSAETANSAVTAQTAQTAESATKATQDATGNVITDTYETKTDASEKLAQANSNASTLSANALSSAKTYTDNAVSGLASSSAVDTKISTHNTSTSAHNDIRTTITDLTTKLNNFLDVNDTTADQLSEVIALINNNKGTLESLTTSKINVSDIINNLTTNSTSKVLSAAQGVAIKGLIDALQTEVNSMSAIKYTAQQLTSAQKTQALANIGAVDESKISGTVEVTSGAPTKEKTVMTVDPSAETVNVYTVEEVNNILNYYSKKSDLPTIVQEAGNSESLVMSQKAVTKLVEDVLGRADSTEYETVNSIDDMTDTSKLYVLSSTGTLWGYSEKTVDVEHNAYDENTKLNYRINSSGSEAAYNGSLITDYIDVEYASNYPVTIKGLSALAGNYGSIFEVQFYDESKTRLGYKANSAFGFTNIQTTLPITFNLFGVSGFESAKYVRIRLGIKEATSATDANALVSSNDVEGLIINFEPKNYTSTVGEWSDTGLTPSSGGNGGNYVTLLAKVNENTSNIAEVSRRVTELEIGSGSLVVPSFWESAVAECITKIKSLQVGRNCITFPFFSDNHQRNGYAGMLTAYIMKECNIPYCFYGGDSISSGTIVDEAEMIEQDKSFDTIMSYVPNGRFCRAVGNHDGYWYDGTNKYYYSREQVYELFLREESIAQNKHFGNDGTYYYIDDIASKIRFIVLNSNEIDTAQLDWLTNIALNITENGYGVVFISHHPIVNAYHTNIVNASDIISAVKTALLNKADIIGWYSGHIHRDRIFTNLLTGGTDTFAGNAGSALGFTQVTITSDNTSIAYKNDDGTESSTKHTIANDDKSHAIDFVTINKNTRTVNLTRLGIGSDRIYTY